MVLPDEPVRPAGFVADEPAERALPFADDEPGRAAHLLGDPVRDLRQVVQVEAQVVGPGAGLGAPVLDDLEVVGLAGRPRLGERVAGAPDERLDHLVADGVERAMLARRGDDRPPRAGRARLREGDLAEPAFELAGVLAGPDDVEREVLEHPDPDAVAGRRRAVGAAEQVVVDRLGGAREPVAVERPIDDGRDPPAGDRVLAQLEQSGGHRSGPVERRAELAREGGREVAARPPRPTRWSGRRRCSPRSRAIEVEVTPGIPHGSISSKSARSTVTLRAIP